MKDINPQRQNRLHSFLGSKKGRELLRTLKLRITLENRRAWEPLQERDIVIYPEDLGYKAGVIRHTGESLVVIHNARGAPHPQSEQLSELAKACGQKLGVAVKERRERFH